MILNWIDLSEQSEGKGYTQSDQLKTDVDTNYPRLKCAIYNLCFELVVNLVCFQASWLLLLNTANWEILVRER